MLDTATKSRIDSARDILVGKVPDPKSQVEQITIALIYKFMDDMDRQSEELGGKATFFTGEFKKFRWAQLLDKRYSGHERLLLYAEGIEKMNENKNIPQLFRDIFKGVFLPYRDPETLNLFLKEIDGFSYDHSERLGDAFEYLLSVLGTQGDAGQFRTPRHIIDFIVAVVDPKKTETILDPACGTAGFLISAYKHIRKANDALTPDERARLMTNFRGYDIAPDMVRLSRVNLYLHGCPQPVIHEYDTLTSEERWDERCDVILANPPFMTPKGGIRPHNKFSIKAKRSEVLFVDYIAEHLNPGGRAGVIVPEGIIFQSQNAYKALRKMLVENYLWAVVSLPAGVFNPYSGVKTSILFMDRNLARQRDDVLFVKIENDGFDLGAQRRPIEKNDLPAALKALQDWRTSGSADESNPLRVPRKRLLESPDINLSGDRYRTTTVQRNGRWPMVKLGEVCDVNPREKSLADLPSDMTVSFVPMADVDVTQTAIRPVQTRKLSEVAKGYTTFRSADVLLAKITPCFENGKAGVVESVEGGVGFGSTEFIVVRPDSTRVLPILILHYLLSQNFREAGIRNMTGSAGQQRVPPDFVRSYTIPLPPLDEQERIAAELEGYRKVIEGARQILAAYKPTIRIDPEWEIKPLGEIAEMQYGLSSPLNTQEQGYRTFRMNELVDGIAIDAGQMKRASITAEEFAKYRLQRGDILFNRTNSYEHVGRTGIFDLHGDYVFASYLIRVAVDRKQADPMFISRWMNTSEFQRAAKAFASRAIGQANINASNLAMCPIPLPPLAIQRQIVAELEAERKLVEANRELISRMEAKIKAKLAEVWGEESVASSPAVDPSDQPDPPNRHAEAHS
ncbi:MAG: N-6 DNA methylase [Kiritimatiellae bacterium]|nr:N-6 DNA methylase [Kiritimatiellia bacterium]MCO5062119.1 N-6 DNA methylase [Kiritimatiellia bacterium]MCO5068457.1 N-6 DNA methylase [Kiritimatiellia bacterium]